MEDWFYQYPSVTLTRSFQGDRDFSSRFRGESDILLSQLKNQMKFRSLGQLKMTRVFTDGTIITAWSTYGQDFVDVDTSRSIFVAGTSLVPSCTITFIDLPDFVQPMKYPGEIHAGEVQGVDYFKTYYTIDIQNCEDCQDVAFEFLLTYATPIEPRHFHNYASIPQMGTEPGGDDLDNHIIYSLEPPCWVEIIDQDQDKTGGYITWKAYTEMGDVTFSRTGLAIPLLRAIINKADGTELCSQEKKFDVDCCRKSSEFRNVEIWWEGLGICEPFIIYFGKHICRMPASVSLSDLIQYSTPFYAAQPLYAIPSIKGGCLPLEWELSGPIKIINIDSMGTGMYFQITSGPGDCTAPVTITLRDRCGTEYIVNGTPACDNAAPMSISYTSLFMGCSQTQNLSAIGGVGPYSWSVTDGGTIAGDAFNGAVYTAPSSNANCEQEPIITVIDCCGKTDSISLYVSCNPSGNAYQICEQNITGCSCREYYEGVCISCIAVGSVLHTIWDCMGTIIHQDTTPVNAVCSTALECPGCPDNCDLYDCSFAGCSGTCGAYQDLRTSDMKTNGCCPINPATGLPF